MRFDVITLFPELFEPFLKLGVTRRAYETKQVDVRLWPLREHGDGAHQRVDDRPFGGGPGMVLLAEPLQRALTAVRADRGEPAPAVIHFTPTGRRIDQPLLGKRTGKRLENFTRVETFGDPDNHWIRVSVNPKDPNIFSYRAEYVRKNFVDHSGKGR